MEQSKQIYYPLFFSQVLKNYMWGGYNLAKLGRVLPDSQPVAESWEIAAHNDGMSIVTNGVYTGCTLQDLLELMGENLVGINNSWAVDRGLFPLMIKIIDAEQRLSVQVHPDDGFAQAHEGNELGKAEMWVITDAKHDASVVYGFSKVTTAEAVRKAIESNQFENYLNRISVKKGDHICVPAGTLHAILEGVLIVEIQQNSNTTYRAFDWNRKDTQGRERELHIEKALQVINFNQVNLGLSQSTIIEKTAQLTHEVLCSNRYFVTERFICAEFFDYEGFCNGSTMEIWGVIQGKAIIAGEAIKGIEFCLLPAKLGRFSIKAEPGAVLLRVFTNKLENP